MTKTDRNKVIKEMIIQIKNEIPVILESIKSDTMSDEAIHYFKCGVESGMKECVNILEDEL